MSEALRKATPQEQLAEVTRGAVDVHTREDLLRIHEDNVAAAARAAGVDRMHLYRLLWRNGLR